MQTETTETVNTVPNGLGSGWKGVIFNICFLLYYYFTYQWVIDETEIVNSYGLSSPILFSRALGWIVLISLLAEPVAIYIKLSYENYNIKGPAFRLPVIFLVIMFISRFFVRIVLFIAALESAGIHVENGGMGAGITGTFVLLAEFVFAFAITDKEFVGKVRPTALKEVFTRFVLLNMLVLFTFIFKICFASLITYGEKPWYWEVLVGLLIFITVYLPNTMVQFYSDWRASKTPLQKSLYILTFSIAFLSIVLFG